MTLVHEAGHVLCGWSCGGKLQSADFLPWHLPYSIFEPDPYPLVTLWGGPVLGVVIPLAVAWLLRSDKLWFIAYFCVLANGMYLATAWISGDRYLDTPKLLEHGAFTGNDWDILYVDHRIWLLWVSATMRPIALPTSKSTCLKFSLPTAVKIMKSILTHT